LTSEPDPPQTGVNIVGNYVHDNNDHDVPGSGITAIAPVGNGIEIAGGSEDIIRNNLVKNEMHAGVIVHWLSTPAIDNQIVHNTFVHVAYAGAPGDADIALDMSSIQNCILANVDKTGGKTKPATVDPPNLLDLDNCGAANPLRQGLGRGIYEPGDPVVSVMTALNDAGITEPKDYKGPGPRPTAKQTMPNPCKGVPANPWCAGGKPRFAAPS